jgi:hypothetical protein
VQVRNLVGSSAEFNWFERPQINVGGGLNEVEVLVIRVLFW